MKKTSQSKTTISRRGFGVSWRRAQSLRRLRPNRRRRRNRLRPLRRAHNRGHSSPIHRLSAERWSSPRDPLRCGQSRFL